MGRIWEPAMTPTSSAPEVQGMVYTTGQTFIKGAYLVFDGGNPGQVIEGTSPNPAAIVGVALDAPGSHPGFQLNFDAAVVARTGTTQQIGVAKANRVTIFSGRMVNGGTDPVTPAQSDIGVSYEVLKTGAGEWVVNQAATVNVKVKIVDIDVATKMVFFRFLESVLAQP